MALPHRSTERRWCRNSVAHDLDGQVQDLRLVLAGAVYVRGSRWPATGEDTTARHAQYAEGVSGRGHPINPGTAATGGNSQDDPGDGQGGRVWPRILGVGGLEGASTEPAALASVQAVRRPDLRRETARYSWPIRYAAKSCSCAVSG